MKQWVMVWILSSALPLGVFVTQGKAESRNIAPDAAITESGRYSDDYLGAFTADGQIPESQSGQDRGRAWCVPQAQAAGATLTYAWPEVVTVGEIVYYGRTAWLWNENFLQVEIYTDAASVPVAKADLRRGHGPQRITLQTSVQTQTLTLGFTRADTGPNPGASEIQIYSTPPEPGVLGVFRPAPGEPMEFERSQKLAEWFTSGDCGFDSLLVIQRQAMNPSHVYTYHNEDFRAGGGLYRFGRDGGLERLVDSPGGQLLDLEMSYDGREVLFSWRRSQADVYQIYRMNVDGTGLVQLTRGDHYNFNPCWLPDGGIAFLSTRSSAYAYCWDSPVGVLYRMDRNGSNILRLSANYLNDFTPAVLHDGRIIYSRWEYVDRPAIPIQSLWTIRPDGTALQVYYGNRVLSPATFMEARPIPGTQTVLCLLTAHNGPARGGVGIIDRRHGVNAQEAITNLTPEVDIGHVHRGDGNRVQGRYENPFPLDEERFVVSHNGSILLRDYAGTEHAILLEPRDGLGFYNPQPIRPTPVAPALTSSLGVQNRAETAPSMAAVYLQDVYQGLEPHIARGEIAAIRVVEEIAKPVAISPSLRAFGFQFPVVSSGATYAPKRVWGQAAVNPDGSATFEVPAGRPIYFMALDENGRALQRMRSFTHLMPGEVQSCIGCHEDRLSAPLRMPVQTALREPPQPLEPPEWGRAGFSYRHIVQPVLDRNCAACHNAYSPSGGVDLSDDLTDFFNVSYETLARKGTPAEDWRRGGCNQESVRNPYTSWISTYNGSESNILEIAPNAWGSPASRLADLVMERHPDAGGNPRIDLTEAEKRRIFAWIDLNVPYYGTSDSNHRDRPGCRQMWPEDFNRVFSEIAMRRCASCHEPDGQGVPTVPRQWYLRIQRPERNTFLLAPLARAAGGTEKCGQAVFQSVDDPDFRRLLATFRPIQELLARRPRLDMDAAKVTDDAAICTDRVCEASPFLGEGQL